MIPFMARLFYPNDAKTTSRVRLVTIGFSHYVEMARWSLQLNKVPFNETPCAPVHHVLPALSLHLAKGKETKHFLSSSSYVKPIRDASSLQLSLKEMEQKMTTDEAKKDSARAARGRATAVPVAALPNGLILPDSWAILEFAFKGAEPNIDEKTKKLLDEEVGPLVRHIIYNHILKPQHEKTFNRMCTSSMGLIWQFLWWIYIGSYTSKLMRKIFSCGDKSIQASCRNRLDEICSGHLKDLLDRKNNAGFKFLNGDEISQLDIAVSALLAPLVMPQNYACGVYNVYFQDYEANDPELKKEFDYWREKEIGKYVLKLYSEERL